MNDGWWMIRSGRKNYTYLGDSNPIGSSRTEATRIGMIEGCRNCGTGHNCHEIGESARVFDGF